MLGDVIESQASDNKLLIPQFCLLRGMIAPWADDAG